MLFGGVTSARPFQPSASPPQAMRRALACPCGVSNSTVTLERRTFLRTLRFGPGVVFNNGEIAPRSSFPSEVIAACNLTSSISICSIITIRLLESIRHFILTFLAIKFGLVLDPSDKFRISAVSNCKFSTTISEGIPLLRR